MTVSRSGYKLNVNSTENPLMRHSWNFQAFGTTPHPGYVYLEIPYDTPQWHDFNPYTHNNNFSIMGVFDVDEITYGYTRHIISLNENIMNIRRNDAKLTFNIYHKLGDSFGASQLDFDDAIIAKQYVFFAATYQYVADGSSIMRLFVNGTWVEKTDARGPIVLNYSPGNPGYGIRIGTRTVDYERDCPSGNIYWLLFDHVTYTTQQVEDMYTHFLDYEVGVNPLDENPMFLISFDNDDEEGLVTTYTAEHGTGDNAPYTFNFEEWTGSYGVSPNPLFRSQLSKPYLTWYNCDHANPDYLTIDGSSADGLILDPSSNNNDFTLVFIGDIRRWRKWTDGATFIAGKGDNGINARSYYFYLTETDGVHAFISKNGLSLEGANSNDLKHTYFQYIGDYWYNDKFKHDYFLAMTYDYQGDGSSIFRFYSNNQMTETTSAVGPIYSSSVDPSIFARQDGDDPTDSLGMVYAYWNRCLSDEEIQQLRGGLVYFEDTDPDCYIDFSKPVASTYESEVGGLIWTVHGSPVLETRMPAGEISWHNDIGYEFFVGDIGTDTQGYIFNLKRFQKRYRKLTVRDFALLKNKGIKR